LNAGPPTRHFSAQPLRLSVVLPLTPFVPQAQKIPSGPAGVRRPAVLSNFHLAVGLTGGPNFQQLSIAV